MRHQDHDEPYIVIEKHSGGVGDFLLGALIGAGVALLFAPRSGARDARRHQPSRARRRRTACATSRTGVTDQVVDTFETARSRIEEQIDTAREAIVIKKEQVSRAMEAGREAAHAGTRRSGAAPRRNQGRLQRRRRRGALRPAAPVSAHGADGRRHLSRWTRRRRLASAARRRASRSPLISLGWTLRDYAKRVWDNAGEDNVLFLAGGIAFNILLAAVPFVLLIVWGFAAILLKQPADANAARSSTTSTACCRARGGAGAAEPHCSSTIILSAHTQARDLERGRLRLVLDAPVRLAAHRARQRVRHREGARDHPGQDLRHQDHDPLHAADHGQRADQHLRAHRDQDEPRGARGAGHPQGRDGPGERVGTRLVGSALLCVDEQYVRGAEKIASREFG